MAALTGDAPGTTGRRVLHGTLLRPYRGNLKGAESVRDSEVAGGWQPNQLAVTAICHEVVMPGGVDDSYVDPWVLPRTIDQRPCPRDGQLDAILCYATVTEPDVPHLHGQWRRGRAIVERLVDGFQAPMLLVHHALQQASSANAPHLHILAAVMALSGRGFSAPVAALVGDKACDVFIEVWLGSD